MITPAPTTLDPARRRTVLLAVCLALMAVVASVSGLNVAQPQLSVEFGIGSDAVLWIINAYTLTLAALLLPSGLWATAVAADRSSSRVSWSSSSRTSWRCSRRRPSSCSPHASCPASVRRW